MTTTGKGKDELLELKSPFPEKLEKSSPFKSSESRCSFVHEFLRAERPLEDMRFTRNVTVARHCDFSTRDTAI
jgi:hypothetical protein